MFSTCMIIAIYHIGSICEKILRPWNKSMSGFWLNIDIIDLYIFSSLDCEKMVFLCYLSVCMSVLFCLSINNDVSMDVYLIWAWMVGQILFIFGIQEFIHAELVSYESEHSVSRNRGLSLQMTIFLKVILVILIKFQ